MVSIAAFQAVDPGSIPGRHSILFLLSWQDKEAFKEKAHNSTLHNKYL
jgi:hypothetical protein